MILKEQLVFAPYYKGYIDLVDNNVNVIEELLTQHMETVELITSLDDETLKSSYAPGKWSILEIISHIIDTERVFGYRALCFARSETNDLPGFNQDVYVKNSNANNRKILDLVKELSILRSNTIELFNNFTPEMLLNEGVANNNKINVAAILYIIYGHEKYHVNILEERYIGKYKN